MTLDELEQELGESIAAVIREMVDGVDVPAPGAEDDVEAAVGPVQLLPPTSPAAPRSRRWLAVAAVLVLIVGAGWLYVRWQSPNAADEPAPPPTIDTTAPATEPVWSRAADPSSIARSTVFGVVGGPAGFVATGRGSDGGVDQGRVWFSRDGSTWEEPAVDLFGAKVLSSSSPAAAGGSFYVVASTNPDRTPEQEGEGVVSIGGSQVYRSDDGRTWTPVGSPVGGEVWLAGAGDLLFRYVVDLGGQRIEHSTDGVTWEAASFEGGPVRPSWPQSWVVRSNDRYYLIGVVAPAGSAGALGMTTVWESVDGSSWKLVLTPLSAGGLVPTSTGPYLLSWPEGIDGCNAPSSQQPVRVAVSWGCSGPTSAFRLVPASGSWAGAPEGPGPSTTLVPLASLGDRLVGVVTGGDGAMTVWSTRGPDLRWEPEQSTRLSLDTGGLPQPGALAVSGDRAVVVSPRLATGESAVLVTNATRSVTSSGTAGAVVGPSNVLVVTKAGAFPSCPASTSVARTSALLVRLDPAARRIALLQLPGSLVLPSGGSAAGMSLADFPAGQRADLVAAVQSLLGASVDHYVEVDDCSASAAVGAGGVTVPVAHPMRDPASGVRIMPGCARLDGELTSAYITGGVLEVDRGAGFVLDEPGEAELLGRQLAAAQAVLRGLLSQPSLVEAVFRTLAVDEGLFVDDAVRLLEVLGDAPMALYGFGASGALPGVVEVAQGDAALDVFRGGVWPELPDVGSAADGRCS